MEERLELFARQTEKRLGELEWGLPAVKEETKTGLQEMGERMEALEERLSALEERVAAMEEDGAGAS